MKIKYFLKALWRSFLSILKVTAKVFLTCSVIGLGFFLALIPVFQHYQLDLFSKIIIAEVLGIFAFLLIRIGAYQYDNSKMLEELLAREDEDLEAEGS